MTMARWLKAMDDVLKVKVWHLQTGRITNSEFADLVDKQPTIDSVKHGYVPMEVLKQVQWERDVAINQLNSYGVQLGEKAELQRVKHGKWNGRYNSHCSNCGCFCTLAYINDYPNFCSNCGARMDGE